MFPSFRYTYYERVDFRIHFFLRVIFYDDAQCETALKKYPFTTTTTNGTLAELFVTETSGSARSDFCRLVMLLDFGGLYFDTDLVVLEDPRFLLTSAHFATVLAYDSHSFFQAFMASVPQHPVVKLAISLHSEYYILDDIDRRAHMAGVPGPKMLRESYDEWTRIRSNNSVNVRCLLSGECTSNVVQGFRSVLLREVCPEVVLCECSDHCGCYVETADKQDAVFLSRMKRRNGSLCSCGEQLLPFHRKRLKTIDCSILL